MNKWKFEVSDCDKGQSDNDDKHIILSSDELRSVLNDGVFELNVHFETDWLYIEAIWLDDRTKCVNLIAVVRGFDNCFEFLKAFGGAKGVNLNSKLSSISSAISNFKVFKESYFLDNGVFRRSIDERLNDFNEQRKEPI